MDIKKGGSGESSFDAHPRMFLVFPSMTRQIQPVQALIFWPLEVFVYLLCLGPFGYAILRIAVVLLP